MISGSQLGEPGPVPGGASDALFESDRDHGSRYVCGADEAGRACWAGPLVAAAVRFDYDRVDANAVARLEHLNDSKKVTPRRRAALLPVILEVADVVAIVVIPAAQIDRDGLDVSNMRALGHALEAVAVAGSVNLVDWFDLQGAGASARRGGGRRSNVGCDRGGVDRRQGDA